MPVQAARWTTRAPPAPGAACRDLVPLPRTSNGSRAAAAAATAAAIGIVVGGPAAQLMRRSGRQRASAASSGNTLLGFSSQPGSKARLDAALLLKFMRVELHRHQVALFDADAVLAGQAAADFDAQFQDVGAEVFRLVEAGRVVGVEHDQRMQVAVAGVEDVGDLQAVVVGHLPDAAQHVGQT